MHNTLGWLVWVLAFLWTGLSFISFLVDIFRPNTNAQPIDGYLSINAKRIIGFFYVLCMSVVLYCTIVLDVSKFHLLWFVPCFHFFGTTLAARIFSSPNSFRNNRSFHEDASEAKESALKLLKHHIVNRIKSTQSPPPGMPPELRFSDKEAFWIAFIQISLYPWDYGDGVEIKLSELFQIFYNLYEDIKDYDKEIYTKHDFFKLLTKKREDAEDILYNDDPQSSGLLLGKLVLGENGNPLKISLSTLCITSVIKSINGQPWPYKLNIDI